MRCRAKYFPPWLSVWLRKDAVPWVTCRIHIFSTFTLKVKALLHLVTKKRKQQETVANKMLFQSPSHTESQPRWESNPLPPFWAKITFLYRIMWEESRFYVKKCDANHIFIRKLVRIPPATGRGSACPICREWEDSQPEPDSPIANRLPRRPVSA